MLGLIALRGWSNTRAIAKMRQIGTSPNYGGLYKTVEEFTAPQAAQLDAADNSFPESSDVPPLAETMVLINQHVEALAKVRKVGWSRLTGHPDIDPPHEALQLRELFRELGRSEKKRPRPFRNWLSESENAATRLEKALRGNDRNSAGKAYGRLLSTCARCHGTYRAGRW